jgi:polyisoprenyl-teichoic acid--peptidoglycan teichoic acid transferase
MELLAICTWSEFFMKRSNLIYDRRRLRRKRIIRMILAIIILFSIIGSGFAAYFLYGTYSAASESYLGLERGEKSKLRDKPIEMKKHPFSILIMGIEDYISEGANGRTDSLILATINPNEESMNLLSIPRDTLVTLPESYKETKINHAYVYGGKDGTIEAIESLLNVPIDYYATINFNGFKQLINEVEGVEVDVPFDFTEVNYLNGETLYFKEGNMRLDGDEALAYARMRKQDPRGDFGRNERQKEIIISLIDELRKPSNVFKMDEMARLLSDDVETNVKISEALTMTNTLTRFNKFKINNLKLEGQDTYIDSIYYYTPDEDSIDELSSTLLDHLNIDQ